ncbi:MAG: GDYXXLXY domain-containing protein [Phycisphaerae bacterium]|nr:GDYXXLXY domain-containing protein [Phycisphaerae bacterium]
MNRQIALFALAVAVQAAILAAVPARQVYTRLTGRTLLIRTAPVDPYNFLSGYHVILNYEIATPADPSWAQKPGRTAYVVLKPAADGAWSAESVHTERPKDLAEDAVLIKGRQQRRGSITYGIESYYIPENDRDRIERDLRNNAGKARAEIKVDAFGNAALVRILIEDRIYEY